MRLELRFIQQNGTKRRKDRPNKHAIQGLIYQALRSTDFEEIHDQDHTKPFAFSDWFHSRKNGGNRNWFFISSPDPELIGTLNDTLRPQINRLKFLDYQLMDVIPFEMKPTRYLRTGSPIVLKSGEKIPFHSFREKTMGLVDFEQHVVQTAIRQYRHYTNDHDFDLDDPLFEQMELRKEVPVPVDIGGTTFQVIGSTWHKLVLANDRDRRKFYNWLTESGMGQKTSLGFGFVQPFQLSNRDARHYGM